MKKNQFFYFILLFIAGCSNNSSNHYLQKGEIDFSFSKLTEEPISNFVNKYLVIPLETRDDAYITRARKILIYNDTIYILENKLGRRHQIYVFSLDGKYITRIFSQGRGAYEYQSISDFDIHPESNLITILDPGLHKLFRYNLNSEYQDEFQLDCWAKEFKYLKEGKMLYLVFSTSTSKLSDGIGNDIYVYDEEHNLSYSAFPFTKPISIGMGNGINLIRNTNGISYKKINTNLVYSIKSDTLKIKYFLQFSLDVLPGNEIENVFFKGKGILDKYISNINYYESSETVYTFFKHNKNGYWGLYNKSSNKSYVFNEQKDPECQCNITLNVLSSYKDYFIIETDYSKINAVLRILDADKKRCANPEIFKTLETLDMTSNPILILVDFNV